MKLLKTAAAAIAVSVLFSCSADIGEYTSETAGDLPADALPSYTEAAITELETEPETEPESEELSRVSFIAAGDNIVYLGNVGEAAKYPTDTLTYNFAHQYALIKDQLESADIAFVNQETLMCDELELCYYPTFNSPQDVGRCLVDAGFDIINVANNHMLDWGVYAIKDTIGFLKDELGVFTVGGYLDAEDYDTVRIYEQNGIRIAVLAYTQFTNSGKDEWSDPLVVPLLSDETLTRQITAAKEAADFVIISVHWGDENVFEPSEKELHFSTLMCELGADVIIGHHPHVIQPVQWLQSENGNRTLCVYSLGNLCAEMSNGYNMLGGLFSFDIVRYEDGVYAENALFTPTVYYFNRRFRDNHVMYLRDFTEDIAATHGVLTYNTTLSAAQLRQYVAEYIPSEFLPEVY